MKRGGQALPKLNLLYCFFGVRGIMVAKIVPQSECIVTAIALDRGIDRQDSAIGFHKRCTVGFEIQVCGGGHFPLARFATQLHSQARDRVFNPFYPLPGAPRKDIHTA